MGASLYKSVLCVKMHKMKSHWGTSFSPSAAFRNYLADFG